MCGVKAAARLLEQRIAAAEAKGTQLIVVSHYPTTWLSYAPAAAKVAHLMSRSTAHITYFGAHVHSTDNMTNVNHGHRRDGWRDFCVGGGGGWACDGLQGFVMGDILDNGRVANVHMRHIPRNKCCRGNPHGGG